MIIKKKTLSIWGILAELNNLFLYEKSYWLETFEYMIERERERINVIIYFNWL